MLYNAYELLITTYLLHPYVMVEVGYAGSSQKKASWSDIQKIKRNMKRSTKWLPIIEEVEEKTTEKEKKSAEQQLEKFLNS